MHIGCGFRVKRVKGRDYVYFWHYEPEGGRSRQVYDYLGPRRSLDTIRRLAEALERYYARAGEEMRRGLAAQRQALSELRL